MASFMKKFRKKTGEADTCAHCGKGLAPSKKETHSGRFFLTKKHGDSTSLEGGAASASTEEDQEKIHEECWAAYMAQVAPKCLHCDGPVAAVPGSFSGEYREAQELTREGTRTRQVHTECWKAFQAAEAAVPKCAECGLAIVVVQGRFSGAFLSLEATVNGEEEEDEEEEEEGEKVEEGEAEGAKEEEAEASKKRSNNNNKKKVVQVQIHAECRDAYHERHAERCCACGEPVVASSRSGGGAGGGAGKDKDKSRRIFSGEYFAMQGHGKCHAECYEAFAASVADKCLHCAGPCVKNDTFSGEYLAIAAGDGNSSGGGGSGGGRVHKECFAAYQEALAPP